jgi:hypothetical protein
MPARSSTFADDLQISREPGWKDPARDLRRWSGRDRLPTSACKTHAAAGHADGFGCAHNVTKWHAGKGVSLDLNRLSGRDRLPTRACKAYAAAAAVACKRGCECDFRSMVDYGIQVVW